MTAVVVVLAVVVALVVVVAVVVARSGRRRYARANEVVPGTATRAPAAWAGAHTPEARLHRRLRDAVAALRANPGMDDAWMLEARVSLEQQALAVDERLVAAAALPERVRGERMAAVAAAVDAFEAAVASLAGAGASGVDGRSALDRAMAEVTERMELLDESRAELEGGDPPPSARPGPD